VSDDITASVKDLGGVNDAKILTGCPGDTPVDRFHIDFEFLACYT
jgi:hypothetical protein